MQYLTLYMRDIGSTKPRISRARLEQDRWIKKMKKKQTIEQKENNKNNTSKQRCYRTKTSDLLCVQKENKKIRAEG